MGSIPPRHLLFFSRLLRYSSQQGLVTLYTPPSLSIEWLWQSGMALLLQTVGSGFESQGAPFIFFLHAIFFLPSLLDAILVPKSIAGLAFIFILWCNK